MAVSDQPLQWSLLSLPWYRRYFVLGDVRYHLDFNAFCGSLST